MDASSRLNVFTPVRGRLMAFIRKRGNMYYLVHNVRKEGRVRQLHLARLGTRPRISDEIVEGVKSKHPFAHIDWNGLNQKASHKPVQPAANNSQFLRELLLAIRHVHMEIADLHLPALKMMADRELRARLTWELELLRGTIDIKLKQFKRGKVLRHLG